MNQLKLENSTADAKRGEMCSSESRLVFVLFLIGSKSVARVFLSQSCSVEMHIIPYCFSRSIDNRSAERLYKIK